MTDLKRLLDEATPGPWYHVQAFESVPAVRTIHGKVPGQRVDYVSTWSGPGTPKGHRVVIPMETVAEGHIVRTVSSADMALIVAAVNALPELLARVKRLEAELAFYADPANHIGHRDPSASVYIETSAVEADGGKRARAALNQEPGQ